MLPFPHLLKSRLSYTRLNYVLMVLEYAHQRQQIIMTYAFYPCFVDQRLDLCKLGPNDNDTVRGQIVGK